MVSWHRHNCDALRHVQRRPEQVQQPAGRNKSEERRSPHVRRDAVTLNVASSVSPLRWGVSPISGKFLSESDGGSRIRQS
jgi:hypothetical protein